MIQIGTILVIILLLILHFRLWMKFEGFGRAQIEINKSVGTWIKDQSKDKMVYGSRGWGMKRINLNALDDEIAKERQRIDAVLNHLGLEDFQEVAKSGIRERRTDGAGLGRDTFAKGGVVGGGVAAKLEPNFIKKTVKK